MFRIVKSGTINPLAFAAALDDHHREDGHGAADRVNALFAETVNILLTEAEKSARIGNCVLRNPEQGVEGASGIVSEAEEAVLIRRGGESGV